MAFGYIPRGCLILHECDNRACIHPLHLLAGNHRHNSRDMIDRNRQANTLSHEDLLRIPGLLVDHTQTEVAALLNISRSHVSNIAAGRRRRHHFTPDTSAQMLPT